jgi:hypothetical protein
LKGVIADRWPTTSLLDMLKEAALRTNFLGMGLPRQHLRHHNAAHDRDDPVRSAIDNRTNTVLANPPRNVSAVMPRRASEP